MIFCHVAGYMLMPDFSIMENPALFVKDGVILEICKKGDKSFSGSDIKSDIKYIDHGPGILIPGVINCHTHMELSFLKGRLNFQKGFKNWVKELIEKREGADPEYIKRSAENELGSILNKGTIAIGDISSTGMMKDIFLESRMEGFLFFEEIGENPKFLMENPEDKLSFSAHAPHTTSPDLIKKVKDYTKRYDRPFVIHTAESLEEKKFISGQNKDWENFLLSRGINSSSWPLPSSGSVSYLEKLGVIDEKTVLVHLIHFKENEIETIKNTGASVCFCPESNMNLHGEYPKIDIVLNSGISCCLGTDSLASSSSIDIFDEMKRVYSDFKLSPETIIKMATINGAKALSLESSFGDISKGKMLPILYIDIEDRGNILESIVFSPDKLRKLVL